MMCVIRRQLEVKVVCESTLGKEVVLGRVRSLFSATPPVGHVVVYYSGPGVASAEGGWQLENGTISFIDIWSEWRFSAAQNANAQLTVVSDSCFAGAMVRNAEKLFGVGAIRGAVTVQASGNLPSCGARFARCWIEFVSGVKTQIDVMHELMQLGVKPTAFSSFLPSALFPVLRAIEVVSRSESEAVRDCLA